MTLSFSPFKRLKKFRKSPETSFKLFYLTYFGALGAVLPYLTLHFHNMGFSGTQIGVLSSLIMAANMGMAPVWTALTDFWGKRKGIFIFNLAAATLSFALLLFARSFFSIGLVVVLFASFRSALVPMANAMVMENLVGKGEEYGRIRIWGSVGYIILALIVGKMIDRVGTSALIYAAVIAYAMCTFFSARGLQPVVVETGLAKLKDLRKLFKNRRFVIFMACSFLVALSGGPYIVFFSISLREMGLSQSVVGVSWMVAVLSEMVFMVSSPGFMRRLPVEKLLILSYITWGLRWYLMSVAASPLSIIAVHLLHGITFGLYYPVAMNFLDREVPASLKNTGQGIFSAMSYGMGGIVGNLFSGVFYDSLGLVALYRMGAVAAVLSAILFTAMVGRQKSFT